MPSIFNTQALNQVGLNLHCIFNLAQLPIGLLSQLEAITPNIRDYKQLILIGHGGGLMWQNAPKKNPAEHPIDNWSTEQVEMTLKAQCPEIKYDVIYPGPAPVGLQKLGKLAGWHHDSPFRIGINQTWGSWFAYRVAVLTNTHFESSLPINEPSPCDACIDKPCVSICPANACVVDEFKLNACLEYRKSKQSKCKNTCLSRLSCPVAKPQKYSKEQMQYHYGISMRMIETLNLGD